MTLKEQQILKQKIAEITENLTDQNNAMRALSGLISGNQDNNSVDIHEINYLMDPIVNKDREQIENLEAIQATII